MLFAMFATRGIRYAVNGSDVCAVRMRTMFDEIYGAAASVEIRGRQRRRRRTREAAAGTER